MTETNVRTGFRQSPLWQLTVSNFKEFYREPIALFWVYGFPLVLCVILGLAFQSRPVEKIFITVQQAEASMTSALEAKLKSNSTFEISTLAEPEARTRLRTAKTTLVVVPISEAPGYRFVFDPNRPESAMAKNAVESHLLHVANPQMPVAQEETPKEPGGRYIDFLIPGLIGANLMGGGLWGVGFGIVDMRVKKLLKRLLATPMKKADFLWSLILSRVVYTGVQVLVFLAFAWLGYGMIVRGNILALLIMITLGTVSFAGFGLLVAARAKKIESAQGLMNLVMLPSYLFSGVFFSSANFPEWTQPVISVLPLTALNNGLRAVINDGAGLVDISGYALILLVWTAICYSIGAKLFRWL